MEFFIRCGLLRGEVYAPSENVEGVAIWYKSGELGLNIQDLLKAGLSHLVLGLSPISFIKLKKLGDAKKTNRDNFLKGEYYFLDCIGVAPALARKGYGRLLIESKLEQIEKEKKCCFLETSRLENIEYYKKYGFDITGEYDYNGLHSYFMKKA